MAAQAAGRDPASIKMIAVSKFQPAEAVEMALAAGQAFFGENYVQEARKKFEGLRAGGTGLELHLVGPLQTNKVEEAVGFFDIIQTLDRPKLAEALAAACLKVGRVPKMYIEVNIGREPQKAGIMPEVLDVFLKQCQGEYGLDITGLMCIPPLNEDPEPHFRHLRKLADEWKLKNVSMGMSADFETAIRCGATEIRIGTAIFGERLEKEPIG